LKGKRVFRDIPVIEVTLRKFEKPSGDFDECLRRFCMSVGLLQPGDSRDIIVDILKLLIKARNSRKLVKTSRLNELIQGKRGGTPPNLRRHLRRLRELGLVEKIKGGYRLREFMSLSELVKELITYLVTPSLDRIMEYAEFLDSIRI